jgi:hypothetical protein
MARKRKEKQREAADGNAIFHGALQLSTLILLLKNTRATVSFAPITRVL